MVFQLLSRELPKGWHRAVPLLLAAGAPGPAGLGGKGHKPEVPWHWAEHRELAAGGSSKTFPAPTPAAHNAALQTREQGQWFIPGATACDLSSRRR